MKKRRVLFWVIASTVYLLIWYFTLANGVFVKYQRNSGPELIIISGENNIEKQGLKYEVNTFEYAYTTYLFDTDYGFENIGISFAFFSVIDSKLIEGSNNQRIAIIEVNKFYSIYLIVVVFVVLTLVYLYFLRLLNKLIMRKG